MSVCSPCHELQQRQESCLLLSAAVPVFGLLMFLFSNNISGQHSKNLILVHPLRNLASARASWGESRVLWNKLGTKLGLEMNRFPARARAPASVSLSVQHDSLLVCHRCGPLTHRQRITGCLCWPAEPPVGSTEPQDKLGSESRRCSGELAAKDQQEFTLLKYHRRATGASPALSAERG